MKNKEFYPEPYSVPHITAGNRVGILIIASIAVLSTITTFVVIGVIIRRLIVWRKDYKQDPGQNQCVVLILNLLLVDSIMGLGGVLSFKWVAMRAILAPTGWCWTQGALLQIGDVANGLFVLALGLHTLWAFISERTMSQERFCFGIAVIWIVSILLTIIGPLQHGADFYTSAGNWCWISQKYNYERLWLNYLWVFLVQLSTIVIYTGLVFHLNKRLNFIRVMPSTGNVPERLTKAMQSLALYPLAFMVFSFPMALSRMLILAGHDPSNIQLLVAGGLVASYGWVDALVYSVTRRVLVSTGPKVDKAQIGQGIEMELVPDFIKNDPEPANQQPSQPQMPPARRDDAKLY